MPIPRHIYSTPAAITDDTGMPGPTAGSHTFTARSGRFGTVDVGLNVVSGSVTSAIVKLWWTTPRGAQGSPKTWHTDSDTAVGMWVSKTLTGGYGSVTFAAPPGEDFCVQVSDIAGGGSLLVDVSGEEK